MSQTPRQMAAGQRRSLARIADEVQQMSRQWEDVDQYLSNILSELSEAVQSTGSQLHPDPPESR